MRQNQWTNDYAELAVASRYLQADARKYAWHVSARLPERSLDLDRLIKNTLSAADIVLFVNQNYPGPSENDLLETALLIAATDNLLAVATRLSDAALAFGCGGPFGDGADSTDQACVAAVAVSRARTRVAEWPLTASEKAAAQAAAQEKAASL